MSLLCRHERLITYNNCINQSISIFLFWSPGDGVRHKWYLLVQWFEIWERNSELREHKCLLLQQETLILSYCVVSIFDFFLWEEHYLCLSKLFTIQVSQKNISEQRQPDMQICKKMIENYLSIGLLLAEKFSQIGPLDYFLYTKCFLNFKVHISHMGILLENRF